MEEEETDDPPESIEEDEEEKEEVPQAVLDKALKRVRSMVRGNGLKPESINLNEFEGEVLNFEDFIGHIIQGFMD